MTLIDILGAFVAGVIGIAALSLIVAPQSQAAATIRAIGESMSGVINVAKGNPF